MQTIAQKILAANGYQAAMAGRTLYVQASDAGNVLTITLTDAFGNREQVQNVGAGAKLTPAAGFTAVSIATTADSNVAFIVTQGDIDIQLNQTTVNVGNGSANPVPVAIVSEPGSPFPVTITGPVTVTGATLTATNVGINNTAANPVPVSLISEPGAPIAVTPTQASSITDAAPVAVAAFTPATPNQVHVRAAGACRSLRIGNPLTSTGKLYIGGSSVTPTNAVIALQPGDVWSETDAPQVDWYATSDTGATANIQVIA
nr:hypothetical protein [Burkholderia ambifaria]